MEEKEISPSDRLDHVQDELDELHGSDETFIFMTKSNHRAVLAGDTSEMAKVIAWNMVQYDIFADVVQHAVRLYKNMSAKERAHIKSAVAVHHIYDVEKLN